MFKQLIEIKKHCYAKELEKKFPKRFKFDQIKFSQLDQSSEIM